MPCWLLAAALPTDAPCHPGAAISPACVLPLVLPPPPAPAPTPFTAPPAWRAARWQRALISTGTTGAAWSCSGCPTSTRCRAYSGGGGRQGGSGGGLQGCGRLLVVTYILLKYRDGKYQAGDSERPCAPPPTKRVWHWHAMLTRCPATAPCIEPSITPLACQPSPPTRLAATRRSLAHSLNTMPPVLPGQSAARVPARELPDSRERLPGV